MARTLGDRLRELEDEKDNRFRLATHRRLEASRNWKAQAEKVGTLPRGLDLTSGVEVPAVYFFDHERSYEKPEWAAGSSVGAFLLLLADSDRAYAEGWPSRWELGIDPNIEKCPRAPAIWATG